MNDGGIDTTLIHQGDCLGWGEVRDLSVRKVAWQSGSPEVNLGVDDLHRVRLPLLLCVGQSTPGVGTGILLATVDPSVRRAGGEYVGAFRPRAMGLPHQERHPKYRWNGDRKDRYFDDLRDAWIDI